MYQFAMYREKTYTFRKNPIWSKPIEDDAYFMF